MSLSIEHLLSKVVKEKLELKKGADVLEEVVKFCYLDDMISC